MNYDDIWRSPMVEKLTLRTKLSRKVAILHWFPSMSIDSVRRQPLTPQSSKAGQCRSGGR